MNKNNFFSFFLNTILGLLFAGSLVFSYFFGNFGGISLKELKSNYTLKESLKFSDLSESVQSKYIDRQKLNDAKRLDSSVAKAFDSEGNPLEIMTEDTNDLKDILKSLQDRVVFLERENTITANDKDELLKIIEYEKSKNDSTQKSLLSGNLEKINEAEQQHYKNISELTVKINDLQRENIKLLQIIDGKKESVQSEVENLQLQLEKQKTKAIEQKTALLKGENIKFSTIYDEKESFARKIKALESDLAMAREKEILKVGQKDQEIGRLQDKINEYNLQKNSLLRKNSENILSIEKANTKKLEEFNDVVSNYKTDKENLKNEYKNELDNVKEKYAKTLTAQKSKTEELMQKLRMMEQNSANIVNENQQELALKKSNLAKEANALQNKYNDEVKKLFDINKELVDQVNSLKSKEKSLTADVLSSKEAMALEIDKSLQLQDKINALEKKDRNIDQSVDEIVRANEEKHNKNYKILNEKVASLQMKYTSFQDLTEKKLKQREDSQSSALEGLKKDKMTLELEHEKLLKERTDQDKKIVALNNELTSLGKAKKELELNENEKLTQIRDSFKEIQISFALREEEYKQTINDLRSEVIVKNNEIQSKNKNNTEFNRYKSKIASLEKSLNSTKEELSAKAKTPETKRKLVMVDSVECDDMNFGNTKLSSTCKSNVEKFLSKNDASNYFEIIPIIDTGGFTTLKLIKSKSKLGIADSEIDRLSNLANLGLGKSRAKEAGVYLESKLGEFAKISYAVYNVEAEDKRGFVIRAYK